MNPPARLSRIFAPMFSLSLLAGYVVYSHQSVNRAHVEATISDTSNDSLSRLLVDDELLTAAFHPAAPRHQLQPLMSDRAMKDALPQEDSNPADIPPLNVPAAPGSLFELDEEWMEATKSETLSLLFPLRLSRAFHSVPRPDDRTWIRPEEAFPSQKRLMDQLADPMAMRTILADRGKVAGRSNGLAQLDEPWNQGRLGEPPLQTSVTVTDYPESGPPTPERNMAPDPSVMMAGSKSGAVRFFLGFVPPKPPLFPRPLVNDPKAIDAKAVEAILNDNGTALAKSGRLLTPEKLREKIQYRQPALMSSSKAGPVFLPPLFDLTPPLLKTDPPIQP